MVKNPEIPIPEYPLNRQTLTHRLSMIAVNAGNYFISSQYADHILEHDDWMRRKIAELERQRNACEAIMIEAQEQVAAVRAELVKYTLLMTDIQAISNGKGDPKELLEHISMVARRLTPTGLSVRAKNAFEDVVFTLSDWAQKADGFGEEGYFGTRAKELLDHLRSAHMDVDVKDDASEK